MSRRIAMLILLATSTVAAAASSHDDDIKLFATTMAIAKTVKESCSGIVLTTATLRRSAKTIDPDYARAFARQQQQRRATYHQRYFWAPGDNATSRRPDFIAELPN